MLEESPVEPLDNRLLAARARAEILKAVFDGRFEEKLPNEDRLAEMLGVSRTTVRSALQGLERDGIVTRRRAIGTIINRHVSRSSLALQRLAGFDWMLEERGHEVTVDVTTAWRTAGDDVPSHAGLEPGEEHLRIDKSYRADGELAITIEDYVPAAQLLVAEAPAVAPPSLFTFAEEHCRSAIHHAVVTIIPQVKHGDSTRLEIDEGAPFIRLAETHYSAKGDVVACSLIDFNDEFIRLEVVRTQ